MEQEVKFNGLRADARKRVEERTQIRDEINKALDQARVVGLRSSGLPKVNLRGIK
jgi:hypothetical protein